ILSQELTKVAVQAGDEARLPCKITLGASLESYYIYWQKPTIPGNSDMVVISFKNAPFSKPIILDNLSSERCDSTNLTLRCLSHGGSSRPEMFGFINKKAVNWTSTVTSNKTLFNITGTLHLNMTENMLVECLVRFSDFHVSTKYSLSKFPPFYVKAILFDYIT
ncbi:hypothetical protein Chor_000396, partial [Crotalus horridus]